MLLLVLHAVLWGSSAAQQPEHTPEYARPHRAAFQNCWLQDSSSIVGRPPCGVHVRSNSVHTSSNAKVALLFLARDEIPTEPIWTAFFASAAELTLKRQIPPTRPVHNPILPPRFSETFCERKTWWDLEQLARWEAGGDQERDKVAEAWLEGTCGAGRTGREVYASQDLFSVYVHRTPGAPAFHRDSLFRGRDIEHREFTSWGEISLVTAFRKLLEAALTDERNSKFLLVSESCIPLKHPALFWAQHMAEAHLSRVHSKPHYMVNPDRQPVPNALDRLFNEDLVRSGVLADGQQLQVFKGTQWSSLTRMHAEIVAGDQHLWPLFSKWCRMKGNCEHYTYGVAGAGKCIADARWVATVLGFYNQSGTMAKAVTTWADWSAEGRSHDSSHPRTFQKGQAELALSKMLGAKEGCFAEQLKAAPTAAALFEREATVCRNAHSESPLHTANIADATTIRLHHIASLPHKPSDKRSEQMVAAKGLHGIMARNLRESGWLGGFRPMPHTCPLMGRKIHQDLVPELLESAWRCDGLGFAWDCLSSIEAAQVAEVRSTGFFES